MEKFFFVGPIASFGPSGGGVSDDCLHGLPIGGGGYAER